MSKRVAIIGSGFSGLAAAGILAQAGAEVIIFEKNEQAGGRARTFNSNGYTFDMGPSWYWMPDVFEDYYGKFNLKASNFYHLKLLDPGFTIFFEKGDRMDVPANIDAIYALFDKEEQNGAAKLKKFLAEAAYKYKVAMSELVYLPAESPLEFLNSTVLKNAWRLNIFNSFHSHVRKFFKSPRLLKLMEFPVLFLGGSPQNIPSLYTLMNYAALQQGTWYPIGGFSKITSAMLKIAQTNGATININEAVKKIQVNKKHVTGVNTTKGTYNFDAVIGASDYHHTESLLDQEYRNYPDEKYWDKKVMSPSSLIFYVGVNKKLEKLNHHNLFFDESLENHTNEIYSHPQWPSKPLFYVCCTSKTDSSTAPTGHENIFILIPLASGLKDNKALHEKYFKMVIQRMEQITGEQITEHIEFKKSYCLDDFTSDYNSYKGNAYGLANTLRQTAFMRPALRNKKLSNLYYCGHLTVPGPGVPPAIISGQIAAHQLLKKLNLATK